MSTASIAGLTVRPGPIGVEADEPEHIGPGRNGYRHIRLEETHSEQIRTLRHPQAPDVVRATAAVGELLAALGVDLTAEGLRDTPERVARAYAEALTPEPFEATTFPNDEGYDELVLARSMPFSSLCEHHLLPFSGVAHVGYLPDDRLIGLSKIARAVTQFSRRLQTQERLTTQIADWMVAELQPKGVGVVLEAEHACMSMRGVRATGARTVTSALSGVVREDDRSRSEFFALARPGR